MIKLSILTSMTVRGVSPCVNAASRYGVPWIELYAFMREDVNYLQQDLFNGSTYTSARAFMSRAFIDKKVQQVAERVHRSVGKLKIVAIASYLPEISMRRRAKGNSPTTISETQNALMFLVDLARALRVLEHPCRVVELVGGSLFDGVWMAKDQASRGEACAGVTVLTPQEGVVRLVENLVPVAKHAWNDGVQPITLALELEPGPFFILGNVERVEQFCQLITQHREISVREVIGLNLDIAHWAFLSHKVDHSVPALISPTSLSSRVSGRIVHGHISDHYKGHTADNYLGAFHSKNQYEPWIDLMKSRFSEESGMKHSGFVSLELESCSHEQLVARSVAFYRSNFASGLPT